jgi:extracellular factor (EF) 3-hydroxypalmitic acid methyl ester biosynthesis protein
MLLQDIRNWCAQLELGIRAQPDGARLETERALLDELRPLVLPVLDEIFARFEHAAAPVEPERAATHAAYARRLLHPLLLGAPFMHRTFTKPLGYAGDYEMVNMMLRDPYEGGSVFAKILNTWFVAQAPAEAHRNRLDYLVGRLEETTARALAAGRRARVASLGCGPAHEVQRFLATRDFAGHADFTLIDFNDETLAFTVEQIAGITRRTGRRCGVNAVRRSVLQILKEAARTVRKPAGDQYDFVYCAGLFDYLPDNVAQRITNVLFEWVAPGGLFVSTNVAPYNPRRLTMDLIMDWHLIYRTAERMAQLTPEQARREDCVVKADLTGVNVFLEARQD